MSHTVVIADAAPLVRAGVQAALLDAGRYQVLHAADTADAIRAAEAGEPVVVLADLGLPPDGGAAVAAGLAGRTTVRTCIWADDASPLGVFEAIAAGVAGFLDKRCAPNELVSALDRVTAGETVVAARMLALLFAAIRNAHAERLALTDRLSLREREVLELISRGYRNREIGEALGISEFTVKRHVQKILGKLELASRLDAAAAYRRASGRAGGEVAA